MSVLLNAVPRGPVDDKGNNPSPQFQSWFDQVFSILYPVQQSGTTAHRPTKNLWTGRPYFDTSLGIPIWYVVSGANWVNASGTPV